MGAADQGGEARRMGEQPRSIEDRTSDVLKLGGMTALGIAVVTAGSANLALQAIANALAGGKIPELDIEGAQAIFNAWIYTAPLAIAVGLVVLAWARFGLQNDRGEVILGFVAGAILVGLLVGNLVYGWFLGWSLEVNVPSLMDAVPRQPGGVPQKLGAAIMWFISGL